MYWFVLPTAFPTFRHRLWNELLAVTIHISLIVLLCALIVRRYSQSTPAIVMRDPLNFTGKVALVTGSSRGIGAEMIKAFGDCSAQCVVNYVADAQGQNKADAMRVADELKDPIVIECDVTQPQQVEAMMKQIQAQRGGLDILVNNSGVISDRTIKKMSLDEFEGVIRVNLIGTFTVTQKAAAILRNGGRVINMSSVSGQMGLFGQANYSSSKAGIIALTKVSAREFARQNITVNAIAPGFIDVGMSKGMPEEVAQNFIKQIPLGRLGDVREIVDAALFLASPLSSYITGHVLNVNGGFYMG
jgi:3-oxoacyl-[acyl-carrier protein] reductase